MQSKLPLIVGFGGYNAAGRSSGHQAYRRMILESLSQEGRARTIGGLAGLMGLENTQADQVLDGTLVRKIENDHFDPDNTRLTKKINIATNNGPTVFTFPRRQMPQRIPGHWHVEPVDDGGRQYRVTVDSEQEVKIDSYEPMAVKTAGQLPSGFRPADKYRSLHHPRGLQMAVLGASDAVRSTGIKWQKIASMLPPDQVSVYSASGMSQLDSSGFGGLFRGRMAGERTSSKQVVLGLNTMPADFINAYVLGSMGSTGGTTGACATFLYNLRQGAEDIKSGRCKVALVGASEAPILPEIIDGFGAMGALATDLELQKLDGLDAPNYRRASRPFGENCGFIIAESSQYVMLMADDLALELGAKIYGAVPGVYVNADGYKKSISAPGEGNYITMAKALGLARNLLGDEAVQRRSVVQAHGSSTPQNRITESKIFHIMAETFGIQRWPISAVKAYVGHSLAAAGGDQLAASLGLFADGILPGIKTIDEVSADVQQRYLHIPLQDENLGQGNTDIVFLNSKGFGGNNATATIFSPQVASRYMTKRHGKNAMAVYRDKLHHTEEALDHYLQHADKGDLSPIYEFGHQMVKEDEISVSKEQIKIPGFSEAVSLDRSEGFDDF